MVHGGVQRHDRRETVAVLDGPAERDGPAPVVSERDDRTADAEFGDERVEVGDPLRQRPAQRSALREAHLELIDGDDAPRGTPRVGAASEAVTRARHR